jgi:hypothetical protein
MFRIEKLQTLIVKASLLFALVYALITYSKVWDFLAYHLPSALMKFNLTTYTPEKKLVEVIAGFPPLPHYFQGAMIFLTGSVRAANFIGLFSLFALIFFFWLEVKDKKKLHWALALCVSIPLLYLHLMHPYVDLFAGVFCGLALYYLLVTFVKGLSWQRSLLTVLSVFLAGLSKMQTWPVIGVALGCYFLFWTWSFVRKSSTESKKIFLVTLIFSSLALSAWPVRNIILYSNPTYPWKPPVMSHLIPDGSYVLSVEKGAALVAGQEPRALSYLPKPAKFWFSVFELGRFQKPWFAYTADMWMGEESLHHRMGGWGVWLVVFFIVGAFRISRGQKEIGAIFLSLLAICLAIGAISQGHELRYWLGIPICFALLFADLGTIFLERNRRWVFVVLLLSLASTSVRTKLRYTTMADVAPAQSMEFWKTAEKDQVYRVDQLPFSIFWAGPDLNTFRVVGGEK